MAKAKRSELVKLAKELEIELEQGELGKLLDAAQDTEDPAAFLQSYAAEHVAEGTVRERLIAPSEATVGIDSIDEEMTFDVPKLNNSQCSGHQTRKVELQLTGHPLARKVLTKLRHHLDAVHARIDNGRHVESPSRALIWLLEQYGHASGISVD